MAEVPAVRDARSAPVHPLRAWLLLSLVLLYAPPARAQEAVGRRVFSDQLVISEPFVEDELSLPSIVHIRRPDPAGHSRARSTDVEAEVKKRLTSRLELSAAGAVTLLERDGASTVAGLQNLVLGVKYQLVRSEATETVLSVGLEWEIGGTGRSAVGAERFDTVAPSILVGKGLGDLPEPAALARPLAVAALLEGLVPTSAKGRTRGTTELHPDGVRWGLVVEYSVPYLRSYVRDVDVPAPLDRMVPIVEIERQILVDRGSRGTTTGTANPGVVWIGNLVQVGVEAAIPLNERTGRHVGVRAFLRFDLDDLLGERLGRPVFSSSR
jgi:hypothetical protein